MAEADGNRTRLTEMLGHDSFEDCARHQTRNASGATLGAASGRTDGGLARVGGSGRGLGRAYARRVTTTELPQRLTQGTVAYQEQPNRRAGRRSQAQSPEQHVETLDRNQAANEDHYHVIGLQAASSPKALAVSRPYAGELLEIKPERHNRELLRRRDA